MIMQIIILDRDNLFNVDNTHNESETTINHTLRALSLDQHSTILVVFMYLKTILDDQLAIYVAIIT